MTSPQGAGAPPSPAKVMSAEELERLRQIGLSLDRAGQFWHGGGRVEHPRLRLALLRWLDVVDGRSVVRLDERRYAYVDVEDAHLRARSARWEGPRCWVLWDDEQERELAYGTLTQASDHALYVAVGALLGRIASPAYQVIAERVEEDAAAASGFGLRAAGARWPIGVRA
ncbi:MAG: hypothetical protein R3B48_13350 [Kofleriaceae bacterium]